MADGSAGARPGVLVVEDEPDLLRLYRDLFEPAGYAVAAVAAPNGRQRRTERRSIVHSIVRIWYAIVVTPLCRQLDARRETHPWVNRWFPQATTRQLVFVLTLAGLLLLVGLIDLVI